MLPQPKPRIVNINDTLRNLGSQELPDAATVYLQYELDGRTYLIPFAEDRYVAGFIASYPGRNPTGAVGTQVHDPETILSQLRERAKTDIQAREAYQLLEEYQYHELLKMGKIPVYAEKCYQGS